MSKSIKKLARAANLDSDHLLVALWDWPNNKFEYVRNEHTPIRKKHVNTVKNLIERMQLGDVIKVPVRQPKKSRNTRDYSYSKFGHKIEIMKYLDVDHVTKIHYELANSSMATLNPIAPVGVKDERLLESAVHHARTSYAGIKKYITLEASAAALMYALTSNHPFHNGNKRTALISMIVFLNNHKISLTCSDENLFRTALKVAQHQMSAEGLPDYEVYELAKWVVSNSRKISNTGERAITKRDLLKILSNHGCIYDESRKLISRTIQIRRNYLYIFSKDIRLVTTVDWSSVRDGEEISKGVIKSLRKNLELDNANGISDDVFYDNFDPPISTFIYQYRSVLNKLAKF